MTATPSPSDPLAELRRRTRLLQRLLDADGRIVRWPKRRWERQLVVEYLVEQLPATPMTEQQLTAHLQRGHAFNDVALLRRWMVDAGLLARTRDGSRYWRVEADEAAPGVC